MRVTLRSGSKLGGAPLMNNYRSQPGDADLQPVNTG